MFNETKRTGRQNLLDQQRLDLLQGKDACLAYWDPICLPNLQCVHANIAMWICFKMMEAR